MINTKEEVRDALVMCGQPVDFWNDPTMPSALINNVCNNLYQDDTFFGRITNGINKVNRTTFRVAQEKPNLRRRAAKLTTCNAEATESCPPDGGMVDQIRDFHFIRETCSFDHCELAQISDDAQLARNSRDKEIILQPLITRSSEIIDNFVAGKDELFKNMIYNGILNNSVSAEYTTDASNTGNIEIQKPGIITDVVGNAGDILEGSAAWNSASADIIADIMKVAIAKFNSCNGGNLDYLVMNKATALNVIDAVGKNTELCCESKELFLMLQMALRSGEFFQVPIANFPPILVEDAEYVDATGTHTHRIPEGKVILVSDKAAGAIWLGEGKNMDKPTLQNGQVKDIPGTSTIGSVITSETRPNPYRVDITHSASVGAYIKNPSAFAVIEVYTPV